MIRNSVSQSVSALSLFLVEALELTVRSIKLKQLICLVFSYLVSVSASSPLSDAAGHNRIYLRAGLDHLSRHRGKQGADCQCAFQLSEL